MKIIIEHKITFLLVISVFIVLPAVGQNKREIRDSMSLSIEKCKPDIPVQFDQTSPFINELAIVNVSGGFGLINKKGEIVTPMIFSKLEYEKNKYIGEIDYDDMKSTWFNLDKSGNIITPYPESGITKFNIYNFQNGLLKVEHNFGTIKKNDQDTTSEHNKYGLIKANGEQVTPLIYDYIYTARFSDKIVIGMNGKEGLIDSMGREIIKLKFSNFEFQPNGKIVAQLNNKYGIIDVNGNIIVPFEYDKLDYQYTTSIVLKDGNYGVIDSIGNVIIPIRFDKIDNNYGVYNVKTNGKYGFYSYTGKMLAPTIYDEVGIFMDELCDVKRNDKWGKIDKSGNLVIPTIYDKFWGNMIDIEGTNKKRNEAIKKNGNDSTIISLVDSELIPALYNNGWGVIDSHGKEIIPFEYYSSPRFFANGVFVLEKTKNNFGCVNTKGEIVTPFDYEEIFLGDMRYDSDLHNKVYQYYGVKKNNKVGLISTNGKLIFPAIYERIEVVDNNFIIKNNGKEGFIDNTGKEITPIIYDEIKTDENLLLVRLSNKWGLMDRQGNIVVPIIYDEIKFEKTDFANCYIAKKNNKFGCLNSLGKVIIPVIYDYEDYHFLERIDKLYLVSLDGKKGCIDKTGKLVIPTKYSSIDYDYNSELIFVYIGNQEIYDKTKKTKRLVYVEKYGCYDKNGNELLPTNFNSKEECKKSLNEKQFKVTKSITNNISIVKQNCRYGFANKSGEIVVPIIYDFISGISDGMVQVKQGDKWGYISINDSMKLNLKKEFNNNELFCNEDNSYMFATGQKVDTIVNNKIINSEIIDNHKENDYGYLNSYIKDFVEADNFIKDGHYIRAIENFEKLETINVYNPSIIIKKINIAKKYQQTLENSTAKIDSIIRLGNDLLVKKKFDLAISVFQQAFEYDHFSQRIKERIEYSQMLIVKNKIESLKNDAIHYFEKKDYISAKKSYNEVLKLDLYDSFASTQINKINDIISFLEVMKTKTYDYKKNNPISCQKFTNYLDSVLSQIILKEVKGSIEFKYDINFDTLGVLKNNFKTIDKQCSSDLNLLNPNNVETLLDKPLIYGYFINSNYNLTCNLKWSNEIFKIKYSSKEIIKFPENYLYDKEIVENFFNSETYKNGNYSLSVKTINVNNKSINYYSIFDFSPTDLKDIFSSKVYKEKFEKNPAILTQKGILPKLF